MIPDRWKFKALQPTYDRKKNRKLSPLRIFEGTEEWTPEGKFMRSVPGKNRKVCSMKEAARLVLRRRSESEFAIHPKSTRGSPTGYAASELKRLIFLRRHGKINPSRVVKRQYVSQNTNEAKSELVRNSNIVPRNPLFRFQGATSSHPTTRFPVSDS